MELSELSKLLKLFVIDVESHTISGTFHLDDQVTNCLFGSLVQLQEVTVNSAFHLFLSQHWWAHSDQTLFLVSSLVRQTRAKWCPCSGKKSECRILSSAAANTFWLYFHTRTQHIADEGYGTFFVVYNVAFDLKPGVQSTLFGAKFAFFV